MKSAPTIKKRMLDRIARKRAGVVVREDFSDLGGYDQVGRALLQLSQTGELIRLGYGVYAKTKQSTITGSRIPIRPLPQLAREAMSRLGVTVNPTIAERDYQSGRSTQVPTGRLIGVGNRVSRKLGYKGSYIEYERTS